MIIKQHEVKGVNIASYMEDPRLIGDEPYQVMTLTIKCEDGSTQDITLFSHKGPIDITYANSAE